MSVPTGTGLSLMKKQYTNESLEEFVKNENEKNKIKKVPGQALPEL